MAQQAGGSREWVWLLVAGVAWLAFGREEPKGSPAQTPAPPALIRWSAPLELPRTPPAVFRSQRRDAATAPAPDAQIEELRRQVSALQLKLAERESPRSRDALEAQEAAQRDYLALLQRVSTEQAARSSPDALHRPFVAENGSYYGEISKATGRPKTVAVRGYFRKDGTYVRGHYRSRPSR